MVCRGRVSQFSGKSCVNKPICKPVCGKKKKIKMLLAGLGSVRIGKNCDPGLENAALGLRSRAAFSRPRSQFFPPSRPITYISLKSASLIKLMQGDTISSIKNLNLNHWANCVSLPSNLRLNVDSGFHRCKFL